MYLFLSINKQFFHYQLHFRKPVLLQVFICSLMHPILGQQLSISQFAGINSPLTKKKQSKNKRRDEQHEFRWDEMMGYWLEHVLPIKKQQGEVLLWVWYSSHRGTLFVCFQCSKNQICAYDVSGQTTCAYSCKHWSVKDNIRKWEAPYQLRPVVHPALYFSSKWRRGTWAQPFCLTLSPHSPQPSTAVVWMMRNKMRLFLLVWKNRATQFQGRPSLTALTKSLLRNLYLIRR